MKSAPTLNDLPVTLRRQLSRKAEEQVAAHLRRALTAKQTPMQPDDVLAWADSTFDQLERPARQE